MERLPLFERKFVKKIAEQRLEAVAQAIKLQVEVEPDPGFMTGLAGQAIFLYAYARCCGISRYENLGFLALERALGMVNDGFSWPSHAAGLAGIRFTLRYLAARGYISPSDGAALDDIDPYLNEFADQRFKEGDYDLLHGALGMFVTDTRVSMSDSPVSLIPKHPDNRQALVNTLLALSVSPSPDFITWESRHPQTLTPEINLGLAHGIPSILWMLCKSPQGKERDALLSRGVDFLMSCRLSQSANGSIFPHRIFNGVPDQPGRLAWCYGDPGIGSVMWQIGVSCDRPDWQADAIGILLQAASRRKTSDNRVMDACVCHGTAGLALMFYKMAMMTSHDEFVDAANYWTLATLDHGQNESPAAGYLFLTTGEKYVPSWSLLEGITGVGLTLLALLDSETLGWEQGLLL